MHHSVNLFYFLILHEQIYQQNSILQAHCIPSSLSSLWEMPDGERLGMPSASIVPPTMCTEQTQRFPLRLGATELGPVSPSRRKGALQVVLTNKRVCNSSKKY